MGTLAFFPWLHVDESISIGDYELLPCRRGDKPFGPGTEPQSIADAILGAYHDGVNRPVEQASIVRISGTSITEDLSDVAIDELFVFTEILGFSLLSNREFFGVGFAYYNRDNAQLVVQRFRDLSGGVSVISRRRDGSTTAYVSSDAFQVRRPFHIPRPFRFDLDVALIRSLLSARGSDRWPKYFDAIFSFNRANTDSDQVLEQQELVLTVGAFERVLGLRGGRERELREAFARKWRPTVRFPAAGSPRFQSLGAVDRSVSDIWMEDLYRVRNEFAHGRRDHSYRSKWTMREHLLLGAYVFPLLVKQLLSDEALYALSDDDRVCIDAFEELACSDVFGKVRDDGRKAFSWDIILGRARWDHAFEKAVRDLGDIEHQA